jgi:hypothetical protein
MRRRILLVLWIVCGLVAEGCASRRAGEVRWAPTGIAGGDAATFLLLSYKETGTGRNTEEPAAIEQTLFACLGEEIATMQPGLSLISPQELRQVELGRHADQLPKSPEAILKVLVERRASGDGIMSNLRYVVLLDASVRETQAEPDAALDLPRGAAVGAKWYRSVSYDARVLDIAQRRVAGRLWGESSGIRAGGVIFIAFIVPVPFVGWSQPDANACSALGQALARFLAN